MKRLCVAVLWLLALAGCAAGMKEQSRSVEDDTEALKTRCLEGDDDACLDVRSRRLGEQ